MLHHFRTQYRYGCRAGFGRRKAISRAVRTYVFGF